MKNKNSHTFDYYPGFIKSLLLAIEYMLMPYVSLVFAVILLRLAHATSVVETSIVSFAILIYGLTTILQAIRFGPIGSGMLFPQNSSPAYFAQSILAVKSGGLPLLAGMTLFSGVVQILLANIIKYIKKIFPDEIADMVMLLIGVSTALAGAHQLIGFYPVKHFTHSLHWISYGIDLAPFILLMSFDRFGTKNIKLFNLILVVSICYPAIYFLGFMQPFSLHEISQSSWAALPSHLSLHYKFSWHLAAPFFIAVLVCMVKITGGTNALLQINKKPLDLKRAARATLIDGIGTTLSGIAGSMGLNASSSSVALSVTLKTTSRYIAFFMAPIYIFTALCPKIALLLIYMPKPISGGLLLFVGASLFMVGAKSIVACCDTLAKQITITLPLTLGFTYYIYPSLFASLPSYINAFTGSALVIATITAMLLNLLFKGMSKFKIFDLAES